jgi:hypothetical protein
MKVLCTMPGRYGDILWSLPTCRALAQAAGEPVDLVISDKYASLVPLLETDADYLRCVWADPTWQVRETAPMTPARPPAVPDDYDRVIHLGYERWPMNVLPVESYLAAVTQWGEALPPLDLDTAWIGRPEQEWFRRDVDFAYGFTDEWFELKYGVLRLLMDRFTRAITVCHSPRWQQEAGCPPCPWTRAVDCIRSAPVFLGCCSALHVLACAIGKPVVLMEPAEARRHNVFYPYGKQGRVTLVLGTDGRPTWDARHVADAVVHACTARTVS